MKRFFSLVVGALAMVVMALVSAFISMRLAIHGREVDVPALSGLSVAEASKLAAHDGLNLTLENRFYSSDVPAGRILAQYPAAGARVRREWAVTITESLGAQRVSVPDLTGQSEHAAAVSIRRLALDPGVVAHLAVPGDPDIVLTQTPPANANGVDGPRLSLLVSDPESSAPPPAYVMPSLIGLTYSAAAFRASTAGLHLIAVADTPVPDPNSPPSALPSAATPAQPLTPVIPARPIGIITAQIPQPGRRVVKGDAVHVILGHPAQVPATPVPSP